jgi:hypothetical protein
MLLSLGETGQRVQNAAYLFFLMVHHKSKAVWRFRDFERCQKIASTDKRMTQKSPSPTSFLHDIRGWTRLRVNRMIWPAELLQHLNAKALKQIMSPLKIGKVV